MTPRRTITILGPLIGLGIAAGTLASCSCWSLDIPAATDFVSRGLVASFGIALASNGPTEVSLLPLPRLGFRDIRLRSAGPDGPMLAEGGNLAVQLDLTALLLGRAEVVSVTLDGATVTLPRSDDDTRWIGPLARLGAQLSSDGAAHPRRVALSGITLTNAGSGDAAPLARNADLALSWPFWSRTADLAGRLTWRGERVRFSASDLKPADLVGGVQSPFNVQVAWAGGSFGAIGTARLRGGVKASGDAVLIATSLPDTLAWLGADMALAPLVDDLAVQARFEARGDGIELPSMRIQTGTTVLDGAGSAELSGRRPSIRATLDADELNLGPLLAGTLRLAGFDGEGWGRTSLALRPLTGGDLDLRLSGNGARLGPLGFGSLAASVMVREDSVDATLNRASFEGGTLKGHLRLVTARDGEAETTRVKANGQIDGLDMAATLAAIGLPAHVLGSAHGGFVLDGTGRDAESLIRSVSGRATLGIGSGVIAGLDLADVIARKGTVAHGALARRNGRTPFEKANVVLRFDRGVGEISEGILAGRAVNAALSGRVSLAERVVSAQAALVTRTSAVEGGAPSPTVFEIAGPWSAVTVTGSSNRDGQHGEPLAMPVRQTLPTEVRAYAP